MARDALKRRRTSGRDNPPRDADTPETVDASAVWDTPIFEPLSWPQSRSEETNPAVAHDPWTTVICAGAGRATTLLLDHWTQPGPNEVLFDERSLEGGLCDPGGPVVSFVWTERTLRRLANHAALCGNALEQFLRLVAPPVGARAREIVCAYVIAEQAVRAKASLLKPWNVRLLFLAALSLSIKSAHDNGVHSADVLGPIGDIVPGLSAIELARTEWELLTLIDYTIPTDSRLYEVYAAELIVAAGEARPDLAAVREMLGAE